MAAQRSAQAERVVGQRTEDELDTGRADFGRQAENVTLGPSRDANLVRSAEPAAKRPRRALLSAIRLASRSARPSAMAWGAPGVVKMSTVSSRAARSSGETRMAVGRPWWVITTRSWVRSTPAMYSERWSSASANGTVVTASSTGRPLATSALLTFVSWDGSPARVQGTRRGCPTDRPPSRMRI